jgi:hypothetical protein
MILSVWALSCGLPALAQSGSIPPPSQPTKTVIIPGNTKWASTHEEALSFAAAEKKLVYVEFDQAHCGNCQRMDQLLYPALEFEGLLASMIPVKVALDSPEGKKIAERYGIEEAPAILVTTPAGRRVFGMNGFMNPDDFYIHIHESLDNYRDFARRVDAQKIDRLSAREALETGGELYRRSDPAAALPRLKRAISAPNGTARIHDEARELLAATQEDLGQLSDSRATIEQLISTTKDPDRRERAELFRAQLHLAENKPTEAYALFQKFQQDHPKSLYRSQVDAMMTRLQNSLTK